MLRMSASARPKFPKAVPIVSTTQSIEPQATPPTGDWFGRFAAQASAGMGSKWAFAIAGAVIVIWATTGPIFHYSDTWQLIINTGTTIVTFLMVFLIQNTQNRDARAINLKLNELIRAIDAARDQMIDIESLSDLELKEIATTYEKIKADCAVEPITELPESGSAATKS
jgi:low affinity Fe/Cu permease